MNLFTLKNGVLTAGIQVTSEHPEANMVGFLEQLPRISLRELLGVREGNAQYSRDGYAYPSLVSIHNQETCEKDVLLLIEKDVESDVFDFCTRPLPQLLHSYVAFGYGFSTMRMLYRLNEGACFRILKRHKKSTTFKFVATVACIDGGLEVTEAPKPKGWFSWFGS